ncbi:MAG: hypothetical protein U1E70_24850 [Acetobacteraceae bacterium]|nr:hypothetical protein [Pseudomonadota bacterium]
MILDRAEQQFRLLTIHNMIWALAMSLVGGFVGAHLLQMGFSVAQTLCIYALLLAARCGVRLAVLPIVRRIGVQSALLLGAIVTSLQFLPLIYVNHPVGLTIWVALISLGECIYWPIYHAANATCGGNGRRGRQIALRQIGNTAISLFGPVGGGLLLTHCGPSPAFSLATALCLVSIVPLRRLRRIDLGPVPTVRQSVYGIDHSALAAFAADGWISAGCGIAWPLILFTAVGASYEAMGSASSAASLAGSLAGFGCGVAIDRGHRGALTRWVTAGLLLGIALRATASWAPWAAIGANILGAVVGGLYCPMLMSTIYDKAKQSGSAYRFHLAIEAGWDMGALLGCFAAALVVWSGAPVTLAVLPSALGLAVINRCLRPRGQGITTTAGMALAGAG